MKKINPLLTAAVMTGLMYAQGTRADDTTSTVKDTTSTADTANTTKTAPAKGDKATADKTATDKASCKGHDKNHCKGKNHCDGKKKDGKNSCKNGCGETKH